MTMAFRRAPEWAVRGQDPGAIACFRFTVGRDGLPPRAGVSPAPRFSAPSFSLQEPMPRVVVRPAPRAGVPRAALVGIGAVPG